MNALKKVFFHQKMAPFFFLAPGLLFFLIYVVFPITQSLRLSLYKYDGVSSAEYIGLDNYVRLLDHETFYVSLANNVWWLSLFLLALPLGLAVALFLNQTVFGIRIIKSLFFFPFVISQVVVGLVFSWFYDPNYGLLNEIITITGLADVLKSFGIEQIAILSNEKMVTFGIIFAGMWPQVAYCMILYLTGLNSVNSELVEAARLDGAKGFGMLWHVILPQLRPATFIAMVVTMIGALRSFDLVQVMTQGGPYGKSSVLGYFMYEESIFNYNMGYGAAIATILFGIMSIFIVYFLWRMTQDDKNL